MLEKNSSLSVFLRYSFDSSLVASGSDFFEVLPNSYYYDVKKDGEHVGRKPLNDVAVFDMGFHEFSFGTIRFAFGKFSDNIVFNFFYDIGVSDVLYHIDLKFDQTFVSAFISSFSSSSDTSSTAVSNSSSVDLLPVLNKLSDFEQKLISVSSSVSSNNELLTELKTSFNNVDFSKLDNLNIDLSAIDLNKFSFSSLNGEDGTFKDGTDVIVDGHTQVYKVVSSQMFMNTVNNYMIIYLLENDNKMFLVPALYVSLPNSNNKD